MSKFVNAEFNYLPARFYGRIKRSQIPANITNIRVKVNNFRQMKMFVAKYYFDGMRFEKTGAFWCCWEFWIKCWKVWSRVSGCCSKRSWLCIHHHSLSMNMKNFLKTWYLNQICLILKSLLWHCRGPIELPKFLMVLPIKLIVLNSCM